MKKHAQLINMVPEVEHITLARPRFCNRPTKLLLSMLNVRLPVENLDEIEVAIVWLLKKDEIRRCFICLDTLYSLSPKGDF